MLDELDTSGAAGRYRGELAGLQQLVQIIDAIGVEL